MTIAVLFLPSPDVYTLWDIGSPANLLLIQGPPANRAIFKC